MFISALNYCFDEHLNNTEKCIGTSLIGLIWLKLENS